jgi:phosphoribosylformylglycinamidine cyclo-ligase
VKYRDAGVDIDRAQQTIKGLQKLARATLRPGAIGEIGGFGGLFQVPAGYREPVMVAGADGVGTKLLVAFLMDKHDTVGIDCVAMNADDVAVTGAEPLFFLDYLAVGKLESGRVEEIVSGVAEGCRQAGCALIGGETAQLPGLYQEGHYDLAGFCVGMVERSRIIDGSQIAPGDVLVGLGSSGLHSNGYSLARRALLEVGGFSVDDHVDELGRKLGEELLEPTRIYARALVEMARELPLLGASHITGGGITDNLPRVLPPGTAARVERSAWPVPPVFELIARVGQVEREEMYRVFNMGIGMILVVPGSEAQRCIEAARRHGMPGYMIGEVIPGEAGVRYV